MQDDEDEVAGGAVEVPRNVYSTGGRPAKLLFWLVRMTFALTRVAMLLRQTRATFCSALLKSE